MGIDVRPATLERFDDVRTMLGPKNPASSVCWCLSHRVPAKVDRELTGPARAEYVETLCSREIAPGVLAYDRDVVVGWAAVAPRADLPFARSAKIPHVDDLAVWSAWCLRVRPGHRGKGVVAHAAARGGGVRPRAGRAGRRGLPGREPGRKVDLTMAYVGTRAIFERAGFVKVADTQAVSGGFPRVLMRWRG